MRRVHANPPPHAPAAAPRPHVAALAVAAVVALFFLPALRGGDFVYRDTGRMHAPTKRWIADELSRGRLPSWNPYAGIGVPVVPTAQDALLHPFTALLPMLPPAAAMKAWILLSFALGAAGAFAWARALGTSPAGAAVAALAFALSGPLVSASDNVQFLTAYAALPWTFAATHRFVEHGGPLRLAGVGGAAALCAAAGDPQAWGFALALVVPYAVALAGPGRRLIALRRGLVALAAAAVASAPFVLPIIAWIPASGRAGGLGAAEREIWNLHPRRLLELIMPDLLRDDPLDPVSRVFAAYAGNAWTSVPWFVSVYLGASVVALALVGAVRSRGARLLLVGAAASAWVALGHHAGFTAIAARVPILDAFRYWEKVAVWIPLLLAPAAALGADALAEAVRPRAVAVAAAIAAGALLGAAAVCALAPGAVAAWVGGPPDAAAALAANAASGAGRAGLVVAVLAGVALLVARARLGRVAPLALGAVVAFDLFGGNAGAYVLGPAERSGRPPLAAALPAGARVLSPFVARQDRWPELGRVGRTWEWSRRTLGPCWNVPLRIGANHDYVGLHEARWARITAAIKESGRIDRLGLFGFSHVVVPGAPELAARVGVSSPFRVTASDLELPAFLVEIPHRGRAYLAPGPFAASPADALAFAAAGGEDGRTAVEAPVPAGAGATAGEVEVEVVRDDPGDTVLSARSGGTALLVLNDLFAPGWTATVDGRPASIVRVNGVARGVFVDAGSHEVRFRYRTPGLALGLGIALAGLASLAAWGVSGRVRGRGTRRRETIAAA